MQLSDGCITGSTWTADDLIELVDLALAQLPGCTSDQPVLVRSDSAGASTRLAWHLRDQGVGFSLGMPIDAHIREAILAQPEPAWTPAVDADGQVRRRAEVVELTARVEDRIRAAKATGLQNLPFDRWRRNAVWLELVLAAQDLTVWAQALLLDGELAVAEPKTLRYRLWHVAARIVRHARRRILRLQRSWPWAVTLARAFARLRALPLRC